MHICVVTSCILFSLWQLRRFWHLLLQVERLSQQLQRLERDLEAAKSAEASARAEAASETKRRALQTAEAEASGANARSEHAQAHNSLQASVRKLEVIQHTSDLLLITASAFCAYVVLMCLNIRRKQEEKQIPAHRKRLRLRK